MARKQDFRQIETSGATRVASIQDYQIQAASQERLTGIRNEPKPAANDTNPLISVITISFNSLRTIARTIDSVASQTCGRIEYLVVDGGSTDGTVQLLRSRSNDINLWISEPDRGISDAFNKGIALSRGEYIAIVNSDDWLERDYLRRAVERLAQTDADFVFGDLLLHDSNGQASYELRGDANYTATLRYAMPNINHPTVVCRRRVYERFGLFDTDLSTAMDYEWLLRGYLQGVRGNYMEGLASHMSLDGISHTDVFRGLREVRRVSVRYGYPAAFAWIRYSVAIIKGLCKHRLERWLPRKHYNWLRQRINPRHRTAQGPSS